MDFNNPLEAIVHYLLIGGMVSLGYWDGFPMMSTLVCIIKHWILGSNNSPSYTKSQPLENIKLVMKSSRGLNL